MLTHRKVHKKILLLTGNIYLMHFCSYIRALGFLYLRYVCAPANLWDWFQYYLEDDEEITISSGPNPTKVTIGKFVRMLITEPKFQNTMLPRIPVPIARDLEKKLQEYDKEHKKQPR